MAFPDGIFFDEKRMLQLGWPLDIIEAIRRIFETDAANLTLRVEANEEAIIVLNARVDNNSLLIDANAGDIEFLQDNKLNSITAGQNISIDYTDPLNPIITAESAETLKNPVFTYTGDNLTGVLYDDGSTKSFTYDANGFLQVSVFVRNGVTITKQFNYDSDGRLINIVQTDDQVLSLVSAQALLIEAGGSGSLTPGESALIKLIPALL